MSHITFLYSDEPEGDLLHPAHHQQLHGALRAHQQPGEVPGDQLPHPGARVRPGGEPGGIRDGRQSPAHHLPGHPHQQGQSVSLI